MADRMSDGATELLPWAPAAARACHCHGHSVATHAPPPCVLSLLVVASIEFRPASSIFDLNSILP
jgi:hypothetical protein